MTATIKQTRFYSDRPILVCPASSDARPSRGSRCRATALTEILQRGKADFVIYRSDLGRRLFAWIASYCGAAGWRRHHPNSARRRLSCARHFYGDGATDFAVFVRATCTLYTSLAPPTNFARFMGRNGDTPLVGTLTAMACLMRQSHEGAWATSCSSGQCALNMGTGRKPVLCYHYI